MNLARYKHFLEHLERDPALTALAERIEISRLSGEIWYDRADQEISDRNLANRLAYTLGRKSHWRRTKSCTVYFPLPELDVVVTATFSAPPRGQKTQRFSVCLQKCLKISNNSFNASHDHLTGLYTLAEFDRLIVEQIKYVRGGKSPVLREIDDAASNETLLFLALHIDYFKTVNDSFGHLYGDLVLRCAARRLDDACKTLEQSSNQRLRAVLARSGGEEFLIAIAGSISPDEELKFAEQLRSTIEARAIPDDGDLKLTPQLGLPAGFELPRITDRRVTISIGVGVAISGLVEDDDTQPISVLKNTADVALYRAKGCGRNQFVAFRDIMARYGRILEHHPATDIVAIDLGRNVNLPIGQEFKVFHPRFSGREPFIFTDGRNQKRLGTYPRVSCGRIEAFDVQSEIAFCYVRENRIGTEFPSGSSLEAVPAGSISHLIPRNELIATELVNESELENSITKLVKDGNRPYSCVFALTNFSELVDQNGPAYVNQALASLFARLKRTVHPNVIIGQIAPDQLAFVSVSDEDFDDLTVGNLLSGVHDEFGGKVRFKAGVLSAADAQELEILPNYALQLAKYAIAAIQGSDGPNIIHFSSQTPREIIYKSRKLRAIDRAKIDYENFVKLDINSGQVENQMALMYYEGNRFEEARSHINSAIELDDEPIYRLNSRVIECKLQNNVAALTQHKLALEKDPNFVLTDFYKITFAYMYYELYRRHSNMVTTEEVRYMVESALAAEQVSDANRMRLRFALSTLSQAVAAE